MTTQVRETDLALGVVVAVIGVVELDVHGFYGSDVADSLRLLIQFGVVLGFAVAAGLFRRSPDLALVLLWCASVLLVLFRMDVGYAQVVTIIAVSYGCSRHGRPGVVWLSGLSIPLAAVIGLVYLYTGGDTTLRDLGFTVNASPITAIVTPLALGLTLLGGPWAFGLVLRLREQSTRSRTERVEAEQETLRAQEIAALRAEQARLARDVHDVVGHSLAVIVAQADSAQFLPDDDLDRIRAALANIAASARQSLGDVRQVLSTTQRPGASPPPPQGGLDSLIDGVRSGGSDVLVEDTGAARPLPPELDVVAYRVLQEMLTNALKHGRAGTPITVERDWSSDTLRLRVRNEVASVGVVPALDGLGMPGMLRRLEGVGGRLDVRCDDGVEFIATAWVPVRPGGTP